jgi:hypothetical protein
MSTGQKHSSQQKTNKMTALNYSAPKNELRSSLKSLMTVKNDKLVIFKKTAKKFFLENGIELQDAPMVIIKNGIYYHLNHTSYNGYKGRKIENAWYAPIVDVQEEVASAPLSAKEIFNSINFINPTKNHVSSVGSYVSEARLEAIATKVSEIKSYLPEGSLALNILTSQSTYTDKQLWVIAYALVKTDYRPSATKKADKNELPTRKLRYVDGKFFTEEIVYA